MSKSHMGQLADRQLEQILIKKYLKTSLSTKFVGQLPVSQFACRPTAHSTVKK